MVTMQEIKVKYPNPVSFEESNGFDGKYCVGGALCKYINYDLSPAPHHPYFPISSELAAALAKANPKLISSMYRDNAALYYSKLIIALNDASDFEGAWKILEKALIYDYDAGNPQ